MTAQPGTDVATQPQGPGALVHQYRGDFAAVLPSHIKPDTWVRLAQGVLRRDPQLARVAQRNVASFMSALLEAARLGLNPGTEEYYLVAFGNEVQGIRGYQGEIELMYRAGAISSVIVEVVRERDSFRYAPGRDERPVHDIDWDADDRGPLRLVYAYAVMKDGATSKVVVLNKAAIADAKKMSRGSDRASSPWVKHEEAMWAKTAAHRLTKWVPTSAEYIREQLRAVRDVHAEAPAPLPPRPVDTTEQGPVDTGTGEVIDAEVEGPDKDYAEPPAQYWATQDGGDQ